MIVFLISLVFLAGCVTEAHPETGAKTTAIRPDVADKIDSAGKIVETTGPPAVGIVTAISPALGSIASAILGVVLGAFGLWKKYSPQMRAQKDIYESTKMGALAAADVIETLVKPNKEIWKKAKPTLAKAESRGAIMPDKIK